MVAQTRGAPVNQRGSRSMVGFSAPLDRRRAGPPPGGVPSAAAGAPPLPPRFMGASQEEPTPRTGGMFDEQRGARLVLAIIDASLIPNPFRFLAEELHIFRARLQAMGVVIAWLVEHNTTAETRRALRRSGCAVASKPLYSSRMAPLLALATARKGLTMNASAGMEASMPQSRSTTEDWQAESQQSFMLPGPLDESSVDKKVDLGQPLDLLMTSSQTDTLSSAPPLPLPHPRLPSSSPSDPSLPSSQPFQPSVPAKSPEQPVPHKAVGASGGEASRGGEGPGLTLDVKVGGAGEVPEGSPSLVRIQRSRSLSSPKARPGSSAGGSIDGAFADVLQGVHVLIAEDTALLKKVAVIRMQKLGCTVVAVSDGKEAVEAVVATYKAEQEGAPKTDANKRFDAILMDCQMPVLDGYGATAGIREAEKGTDFHTPIIALTAHAMTSDERKCLDAGMDAYLTKPIDPALMASTILRLVKKPPGSSGTSIDEAANVGLPHGAVIPPPSPLNPTAFDVQLPPSSSIGSSHRRTASSENIRRPIRTNSSVSSAKERYSGKS
eukprot:TRINITY_DN1735_c0_g2_i1.p1 TRINITY_DN1735_c0_g2~~TRINITY_DN1735_c0_g2_i1.p1  ORF type:complete len:575 (-),score=105.25 TRINITY_DN1735_c0_g2_i1:401-2053(-)